jgi:hypothetical protein
MHSPKRRATPSTTFQEFCEAHGPHLWDREHRRELFADGASWTHDVGIGGGSGTGFEPPNELARLQLQRRFHALALDKEVADFTDYKRTVIVGEPPPEARGCLRLARVESSSSASG